MKREAKTVRGNRVEQLRTIPGGNLVGIWWGCTDIDQQAARPVLREWWPDGSSVVDDELNLVAPLQLAAKEQGDG